MKNNLSLAKMQGLQDKFSGASPTCIFCKKQLVDVVALGNHLTEHFHYRRHTCDQCDFFSVDVSVMATHARSMEHRVSINAMRRDIEKEQLLMITLERASKKAKLSQLAAITNEDEIMEETEAEANQEAELPTQPIITEVPDTGSENGTMETEDADLLPCQHNGCVFNLRKDESEGSQAKLSLIKKRHIEEVHYGKVFCPVTGCSRTVKFKHMNSLSSHIANVHNGVSGLTEEERDKYKKLRAEVKELHLIKLPICFP